MLVNAVPQYAISTEMRTRAELFSESLQRSAIELKTEFTQDTDSPAQQRLSCVHSWWVGTGTKLCCVQTPGTLKTQAPYSGKVESLYPGIGLNPGPSTIDVQRESYPSTVIGPSVSMAFSKLAYFGVLTSSPCFIFPPSKHCQLKNVMQCVDV